MTDSVKYSDQADPKLDEATVIRVLQWDDKQDEKLVGEPVDNPMVDCHPISATQASFLEKYINQFIELGLFDYFLECDAI